MKNAFFMIMLALGVTLISVQGAHSQDKGKAGGTCVADSGLAAKGKPVYTQNCQMCHGVKGDVTGPEAAAGVAIKARNLVADPFKNPKGATVEGVFGVLEKGLPGTAMVSFGHLPAADRCALANYVVSLRKAKN